MECRNIVEVGELVGKLVGKLVLDIKVFLESKVIETEAHIVICLC